VKKLLFIIISLLVFATNSYSACTGSSPTWTTTPDYASVSECVDNATAEDTINVSADNATWTNQLVITKGVYLIGAGSGQTNIYSNYTANDVSHTLNT